MRWCSATGADTVICDGELSPAQLNALEKAVKVKVIDRTALILDIFAQHATSREGKAQVSLAQMEYMLPRLRGWGESMSRQAGGRAGGSGGGVGLRGPGETKIETDRRRIRERMSKLRREIKDMKQVRDTQRSRRLHSDMPSIAIVGYTNAGKSSLLNALTGAGVLVQDALFATLEPTTRRGQFDDGRAFVVSDTVGFVRHLPTQLVEAFRSTLEEVVDADLLVHVVDGSDVNPLAQISAVRQVISEVFADHDSGPAPELIGGQQDRCRKRFGAGQAAPRVARGDVRFGSYRRRDRRAAPADGRAGRTHRHRRRRRDPLRPWRSGVPRARRRPGSANRAHQRRHPDQSAGTGGAGRKPAPILGDLRRSSRKRRSPRSGASVCYTVTAPPRSEVTSVTTVLTSVVRLVLRSLKLLLRSVSRVLRSPRLLVSPASEDR